MIVSDIRAEGTGTAIAGAARFLKRHKYLVLLLFLSGLAAGLIGYATAPLTYVSETVLTLDVRRVQALPSESVVSPLPQDSPVLRTELDIISSRMMALRVVELLEGEGVAIRGTPPDNTFLARLSKAARQYLEASAQPTAVMPQAAPRGSEDERAKIDNVLSTLRVSNDGRSYTIFISYRAADPAYAAQVANAFAQAYLDHLTDVQRSATRRVSTWLGETLVNLRAQLETSEKAVEDFRQKAGLTETSGPTLQTQRVAAINNELVLARASLAGARARLKTVNALSEGEDVPALTEILGSATIQNLRAEKARVERSLEMLRQSGAIKSTQIAALSSEASALNEQIAGEVQQIINSLSSEIEIARQKEAVLNDALMEAQGELSAANRAEVELAQLEREANANRTIYESYLVRYKQTIEQDGIVAPEARIISVGEPAKALASPRLPTWLLFGAGLGASAALAGAALREAYDRQPHWSQQIARSTGIPVIGAVPLLTRAEQHGASVQAMDASTRFGKALANVRIMLQRAADQQASGVFVLTAASTNAGTTTLAAGLARAAVASGLKTVVVDANLRNPDIAVAFGVKPTAFIDEILTPGKRLDALLQTDPASPVRFIAARSGTVAPEKLLAGAAFEKLVARLKKQFDLVLIDTPDLARTADALQAAITADRVFMIVRVDGNNQLERVVDATDSLKAVGRLPEGLIFNCNQAEPGNRHAKL